jgi:hypothetical protein
MGSDTLLADEESDYDYPASKSSFAGGYYRYVNNHT